MRRMGLTVKRRESAAQRSGVRHKVKGHGRAQVERGLQVRARGDCERMAKIVWVSCFAFVRVVHASFGVELLSDLIDRCGRDSCWGSSPRGRPSGKGWTRLAGERALARAHGRGSGSAGAGHRP